MAHTKHYILWCHSVRPFGKSMPAPEIRCVVRALWKTAKLSLSTEKKNCMFLLLMVLCLFTFTFCCCAFKIVPWLCECIRYFSNSEPAQVDKVKKKIYMLETYTDCMLLIWWWLKCVHILVVQYNTLLAGPPLRNTIYVQYKSEPCAIIYVADASHAL